MEFGENSRKPEDQEVESGEWGGNRNLKADMTPKINELLANSSS